MINFMDTANFFILEINQFAVIYIYFVISVNGDEL